MVFDLSYSDENWSDIQSYLSQVMGMEVSIDEAARKSGLSREHIHRILSHKSNYFISTIQLFNTLGYTVIFDPVVSKILICKKGKIE